VRVLNKPDPARVRGTHSPYAASIARGRVIVLPGIGQWPAVQCPPGETQIPDAYGELLRARNDLPPEIQILEE
jgi:hypothetical protein